MAFCYPATFKAASESALTISVLHMVLCIYCTCAINPLDKVFLLSESPSSQEIYCLRLKHRQDVLFNLI